MPLHRPHSLSSARLSNSNQVSKESLVDDLALSGTKASLHSLTDSLRSLNSKSLKMKQKMLLPRKQLVMGSLEKMAKKKDLEPTIEATAAVLSVMKASETVATSRSISSAPPTKNIKSSLAAEKEKEISGSAANAAATTPKKPVKLKSNKASATISSLEKFSGTTTKNNAAGGLVSSLASHVCDQQDFEFQMLRISRRAKILCLNELLKTLEHHQFTKLQELKACPNKGSAASLTHIHAV